MPPSPGCSNPIHTIYPVCASRRRPRPPLPSARPDCEDPSLLEPPPPMHPVLRAEHHNLLLCSGAVSMPRPPRESSPNNRRVRVERVVRFDKASAPPDGLVETSEDKPPMPRRLGYRRRRRCAAERCRCRAPRLGALPSPDAVGSAPAGVVPPGNVGPPPTPAAPLPSHLWLLALSTYPNSRSAIWRDTLHLLSRSLPTPCEDRPLRCRPSFGTRLEVHAGPSPTTSCSRCSP